jgi:cation diffusion facilitator CzcD-associated flavoprotein CzcO
MKRYDAIVIGAGISGIGAAYYLAKNGFSYRLLEQSGQVGGIWNSQRWHGSRCDSDFIKYSFSFKPFLSERCLEPRERIQGYLHEVAREFGILEHIQFDSRVVSAQFESARSVWVVRTERETFEAQFLFNGNGYFTGPHVPTFPGAERFKGEIVHTFDLDAQRRFYRERLVLVGSGSTAICAAPELARVSGSLTLVQRSPSYIYEIDNAIGPVQRASQWLYRRGLTLPVKLLRAYLQFRDDLIFVVFRRFPGIGRWIFRKHWADTVDEATYRKHFTPRYGPWEQRIAIGTGYKAMIKSGRVALKTGEIARFEPHAVVLKGGERIPCDVCVLATGFDLGFLKFDLKVGDTKVDMAGINFYKGIMFGGVPNYFQPVGVWHSAWTQRSETATRYALRVMKHMRRHRLSAVTVGRREVTYTPAITPNYIMRCLAAMPRLHGSFELPTLDNLVAYRFNARRFRFS